MFTEQSVLSDLRNKQQKTLEYITDEIVHIRGGSVSPALVESLMISVYEGSAHLKLRELASIFTEGHSNLLITPFDSAVIQDIEKALLTFPLNLQPRVEDKTIRLQFPPLSEEQRRHLLKVVSQKIEEGKVHFRAARDEARRKIKTAFEEKEISQDLRFRIEKEIDKSIHGYTEKLDEMEAKKKKEIMEV